ncbi:outer-membrane lipoprotein carrier protein LolA, partial [Singulisphaera rosea]
MRWDVKKIRALTTVAVAALSLSAAAQEQPRSAATRPPAAKSAPTTKAAPVASPPIDPQGKRMDELLKFWAQRSSNLKTLDVVIKQTNTLAKQWGGKKEYREGRAFFQTPNLACIDFKSIVGQGAASKKVDYERIVVTGKDVWHYRSESKQIFIYPLGREQRERALDEGPLPFLFNFRADEAKKRYKMSLLREDQDNYLIDVLPLEEIDKESFGKALIRLDKKQFLPTKIALYAPGYPADDSMKFYELANVRQNVAVPAENFRGQRLANWKVEFVDSRGLKAPTDNAAAPAQARQP